MPLVLTLAMAAALVGAQGVAPCGDGQGVCELLGVVDTSMVQTSADLAEVLATADDLLQQDADDDLQLRETVKPDQEAKRRQRKEEAQNFPRNSRVEVRDDPEEEWKSGKVKGLDPVKVMPDGWDQAFTWKFVRPKSEAPKDRVDPSQSALTGAPSDAPKAQAQRKAAAPPTAAKNVTVSVNITPHPHPHATPPAVPSAAAPAVDRSTSSREPRMRNARGKAFDVGQPGAYVLLEVPSLLRLEGTIDTRYAQCVGVVTDASLHGPLFGKDAVRVRAGVTDKRKDHEENNWPFGIKMKEGGPWLPLPNVSAGEVVLGSYKHEGWEAVVKAGAAHNQSFFSISIHGPTMPANRKTVLIMADGKSRINLNLLRLGKLGHKYIGGLLGTDEPKAEWLEPTRTCKHRLEKEANDTRVARTALGDFLEGELVAAASI